MTFNACPVPVLDSDSERCRHVLWQRIAQLRAQLSKKLPEYMVPGLRAQLQVEPTQEAHHELGTALEELRSFDYAERGGDA